MGGIVDRNAYCQFLLVSQTNYTLTYFARHSDSFSHDAATRYLVRDRIRPSTLFAHAAQDLVLSAQGYLVFDDSVLDKTAPSGPVRVLDKNYSRQIEGVCRQYSGNEHRVIRGIGLVSCVYVNPEMERYWVIDYRFYDPDFDGRTKIDHVSDMLNVCIQKCQQGRLDFQAVLMDTWYATTRLMVQIHRSGSLFYCPIRSNRAAHEVGGEVKHPYQKVETLDWSVEESDTGKPVHLRGFPQDLDLKLFRVVCSTADTDYIVTNDATPQPTQAVQQVQGFRWKVEQFYREAKQITGLEACQCRSRRAQRNHIGCALLVWTSLKAQAERLWTTIYTLKQGLLDEYMRQQLRSPSIPFQSPA